VLLSSKEHYLRINNGMDTLTELSLYTGYGGFTLGLRLAGIPVRTVCYVEIDKYRQRLIEARIKDGLLDDAPIWDDARTFDGEPWRGTVDIITAGFPCQPHSVAGQRRGAADERNLWPDTARVIGEVAPRIILLENVPGIISTGYALQVIGDLARMGYDCEWGIVSARDAGANHLRKRWWVLAYTFNCSNKWWKGQDSKEDRIQSNSEKAICPRQPSGASGLQADVANASSAGRPKITRGTFGNEGKDEGWTSKEDNESQCDGESSGKADVADTHNSGGQAFTDGSHRNREEKDEGWKEQPQSMFNRPSWWAVEPELGRVAHGVANRVDRLKALGDGIVPAVVAEFLRRIATR
jgi:DNA (cytosine-5)-methyltransferase 1